jgi:hypothetical protein
MFRRLGRSVATIAVVALAMLATAAPGQALVLGGSLLDAPNSAVCPTSPPQLEATCTESQVYLEAGREAPGTFLSEHRGVITSWQVASGPASATTSGVQMRLRLLHGAAPVAGATTPYVALPLAEPGIHRFPVRLPLGRAMELGLDLTVLGTSDGAGSAPVAHSEPGIGEIGEWAPSLGTEFENFTSHLRDSELLIAARVEPDSDHDGYGDRSQDRCAFDPRRHSPCLPDQSPPQFQVHYLHRQSFLATGSVSLSVEPKELSEVLANGQLQTPAATWGAHGDRAWVREAGRSAKLVLELPPRARKRAQAVVDQGGRVYVKSFVTVIDASGNRRHETIKVLPKES